MFRGVVAARTLINTNKSRPKRVPKKKQKKRKRPVVCLPFMWPTFIGSMLGLIIICVGIAMCFVGYYEKNSRLMANENVTTTITTSIPDPLSHNLADKHMNNLTIVGPVLMGFGCFVVVVACVVVCEARDKVVAKLAEEERLQEKKTPDVYDKIVKKMKEPNNKNVGINNPAFDVGKETESSIFCGIRRSSSNRSGSSISNALKNMTSQIFTIDMENSNRNSLHPVGEIVRRRSLDPPRNNYPSIMDKDIYGNGNGKFPSTSCLHDMAGVKHNPLPMVVSDDDTRPLWMDQSDIENLPNRLLTPLVPFHSKQPDMNSEVNPMSDGLVSLVPVHGKAQSFLPLHGKPEPSRPVHDRPELTNDSNTNIPVRTEQPRVDILVIREQSELSTGDPDIISMSDTCSTYMSTRLKEAEDSEIFGCQDHDTLPSVQSNSNDKTAIPVQILITEDTQKPTNTGNDGSNKNRNTSQSKKSPQMKAVLPKTVRSKTASSKSTIPPKTAHAKSVAPPKTAGVARPNTAKENRKTAKSAHGIKTPHLEKSDSKVTLISMTSSSDDESSTQLTNITHSGNSLNLTEEQMKHFDMASNV